MARNRFSDKILKVVRQQNINTIVFLKKKKCLAVAFTET
jgi:hypothetical protein